MNIIKTNLSNALIIEDKVYSDDRGFFKENWNEKLFQEKTGIKETFVQDNYSHSKKGVLRGLHYQLKKPQGKLVRVIRGKVIDVIVDLRKNSPTYGKHLSFELSEQEHNQIWVPKGFAHGYVVLSNFADFLYKTTEYYDPSDEHCIVWNDKTLGIDWKINDVSVIISEKDKIGRKFKEAQTYNF